MTEAKTYKVEGFGEDFIPSIYDFSVIDDVVRVTDGECFRMTRRLVREEGLYTGGSGGAAVAGAIKWAERQGGPTNVVVILPDSASRYLSKIFDDDWMREHGFLGEPLYRGTVQDILLAKQRPGVVTARADEPVREVINRMIDYGLSQLPVLDGNEVVGLVNENDLLSFMLKEEHDTQQTVDTLTKHHFSAVDPTTRISVLAPIFAQGHIVLVFENKKLMGILTKIDLIEHVSRALV